MAEDARFFDVTSFDAQHNFPGSSCPHPQGHRGSAAVALPRLSAGVCVGLLFVSARQCKRRHPAWEVTATTSDGALMGVRHRNDPIHGVQFHSESIGTDTGDNTEEFHEPRMRSARSRFRRQNVSTSGERVHLMSGETDNPNAFQRVRH